MWAELRALDDSSYRCHSREQDVEVDRAYFLTVKTVSDDGEEPERAQQSDGECRRRGKEPMPPSPVIATRRGPGEKAFRTEDPRLSWSTNTA